MMNVAFDPAFVQRVSAARPAEMTALLLEEAIRSLDENLVAMTAGDIERRFNEPMRALKIVGFLNETLNYEDDGDVAINLDKVYRLRWPAFPGLIHSTKRMPPAPLFVSWPHKPTLSARSTPRKWRKTCLKSP